MHSIQSRPAVPSRRQEVQRTPTTPPESTSFDAAIGESAPAQTLRLEAGFASPRTRTAGLEWLSRGLRPDRPERLAEEYPLLFARNGSAVPVFLFEDREARSPRAGCVLWAVSLRVGVARVRIGMISLVYTEPDARGRGHARRVVERAVEEAHRLRLGLVLLWSDLGRFYERLGFVEAGAESLLTLDRGIVDRALASLSCDLDDAPLVRARIEAPSVPDALAWREIDRLRGDRECQVELDAGEFDRLRSIPDMKLRIGRGDLGSMGFAICGRGEDFREVIHEWGGDPGLALLCCRALLGEAAPDHELLLLAPAVRSELSWALRRAGARVLRKPMAWVRIACPTALAEDLAGLYPELAGLEVRTHAARDAVPEELDVSSPRGRVRLSSRSFLAALLGSTRPADDLAARAQLAAALTSEGLDGWPIPLALSGLESI